jgi:hypothetical protein
VHFPGLGVESGLAMFKPIFELRTMLLEPPLNRLFDSLHLSKKAIELVVHAEASANVAGPFI